MKANTRERMQYRSFQRLVRKRQTYRQVGGAKLELVLAKHLELEHLPPRVGTYFELLRGNFKFWVGTRIWIPI
jgi:hypothetical protein